MFFHSIKFLFSIFYNIIGDIMRKNIGIILMFLGVLLTVSFSSNDLSFIEELKNMIVVYWPLLLSFFGIYLVSTPRRRR